jgi:epoxyqueuosine reductase QueG
MITSLSIKELLHSSGCDSSGIANVKSFENAPKGFHPVDIYSEAKSVIVFGKPFLKGTYLADSKSPYTMVRNQLIQFIDNVSLILSQYLELNGYIAVPVPSGEPYEYWNTELRHGRGILSLKQSAELAGLGRIGKNTLLVNEKFGNRLWLGAVITNIELEPDAMVDKSCPEICTICLDICPQNALDGISINQKKCREICFSSTEGGGWLIACNLCRISCPYSKLKNN